LFLCGFHQAYFGDGRSRLETSAFSDEEESGNNFRGSSREAAFATSRAALTAVNAISALHEIGQKVKRAVQYRTNLRSSTHLGFTVEIMFGGEKVGEGVGRTKKEAKYNAAESALLCLAKPVKEVRASRGPRDPRLSAGIGPLPIDDDIPIASTSGHVSLDNYRSSEEPIAYNSVTALKDLCTKEAINIQFKALPSSGTAGQRRAFHCQVLLSPYSAE